jgi:hypothetical protein
MSYSIDELQAALVQADAAGDTRSAQILADQIASQQADRYVKQQPLEQEADWWTGLKKGAVEEGEKLIAASSGFASAILNPGGVILNPHAAQHLPEMHPYSNEMKSPETLLGKVAEVTPGIATAIPGWEVGAGAVADTALLNNAPKVLQWATKGLVGTLGSDITSGEEITPGNLTAGTVGNVAAETLLHTPKGLRLISAMIQKNDSDILDAAAHIGVEPTAAMTSARKWLQTLEHRVGALPGGGIVGAAHEKVNQGLEAFFSQIKSGLGHVADTNELGGKIETALKGYVDNIKNESELAYDQVMKKLGREKMTNTRRFTRKVQELYGVNPRDGMEKIATTPVVRRYMDALEAAGITPQDTGYGNVVMNIKEARDVLKILDDYIGTGESATQDAAAAKQMATALREDINGTFLAHGLGQQWRAVQDRYAAEMGIIDQANQVFRGAKGGDQYYTRLFGNPANAFKPMGKDTITALKAVMPDDVMNSIRAEVVHRMGLESAGAAATEGRTFSPANYLTNWNKLDQPAKDALFNLTQQGDQEALAKVSEGIKRLNGAKNHSNTASHVAIGGMISALFTHPLIGAAGLVGTTAGARAMGMLLTHPEAAQILSSAAAAPLRERVTKWVPMLVAIVAANPEMAAEFESAMSEEISN